MRIVSGINKGKTLTSPSGLATRPTSDRARQAVFNILVHAPWAAAFPLEEAQVLDGFAGTGAMGLEALSRGAASALFIEQDRAALAACRANITALGHAKAATVLAQDILRLPPCATTPACNLIFLDPPYGKNLGLAALSALQSGGWVAPAALCVMEMARRQPESMPEGWTLQDERTYGVALVRFLTRAA